MQESNPVAARGRTRYVSWEGAVPMMEVLAELFRHFGACSPSLSKYLTPCLECFSLVSK